MAKVTRSNPNAFNALDINIKELGAKQGKVGWFENARYPEGGTTVAHVAAIQEFGSPQRSIPPRPFMRPAITEHGQEWKDLLKEGAKKILQGKENVADVLEKAALNAQNEISQNIATLGSPPLSPITLGARKLKKEGRKITGATIGEIAARLKAGTLDISGVSTKPLEDTGLLSATLTSVVEDATA